MFKSAGVKATLGRINLACTKKKVDGETEHTVQTVFLFSVPLHGGASPELRAQLEADFYPGMGRMEDVTRTVKGSYTVLLTGKFPRFQIGVFDSAPEQRVGKRKATFLLPAAELKGKPRLCVVDGKSTLELVFVDDLDGKLIDKLSKYIDGEVWLDVFPVQETIPFEAPDYSGKEQPVPPPPGDRMTAGELEELDELAGEDE